MKQIEFYGDMLDVVELENGQPGVAMRRLVENLGLDWKSQSRKLEDPIFSCGHMTTTGSDGKQYQMLVMPVKSIPAYLFSINSNKIREDLREKLALYRLECVDVLYNYWAKGYAVNPRVTPEDNLSNFYHSSGDIGVNFLQGMLDQTADTPVHNEVMGKIIGHIIQQALRGDDIDLATNRVYQDGKWRYLSRSEIISVMTLELEIGAWIGRGSSLPQSEEGILQMAKDIGRLAYQSSRDSSFTLHLYSERFETPLKAFLAKV